MATAPPERPAANMIIAVDFGTMFTGVAYFYSSSTSEVPKDQRDAKETADKINVIKTWPNVSAQYTEKTPTVIAYHSTPPTWGGTVKPQHEPQISRFKLGLEPDVPQHYGYLADQNAPSIYGKHPDMPNKEPVDFATDYLQCIYKFVQEKFFPSQFGTQFLRDQRISYVVTVPAIWGEKAKELTREAASIAFKTSKNEVALVPEPEAAALFCATTCQEVDLNDGDQFLLCDAGGGTVDLIAYRILTRYPFEIKECSIGTGAACGAVYLDEGFEKLVKQKLGRNAPLLWTARRALDAAKYFENGIKRHFNPYDRECELDYEIPLVGAADAPDVGLEAGYLMLKKHEIQKVFDPVFNQILELIEKQIAAVKAGTNSPIKTLFLVGGLGSNGYLGEFLNKKLRGQIDVKQPMSGYTAIMKGAVLNGLGVNFVKERLMRRSYGVTVHPVFVEGEHSVRRRFVDVDGTVRCRDVMNWYSKKGDKVENGHVEKKTFLAIYKTRTYKTPGSLLYRSTLYTSEKEIPPSGPTYKDSSVSELCHIDLDLRKLPREDWKKSDDGLIMEATYVIGLQFGRELVFQFMSSAGILLEKKSARYT